MSERNFIKEVAESGHAEVEASQLALSRATDSEVKEFAQQMVDDHTRANAELQKIARAKGVNLPSEPSFMAKAKLKALDVRKGAKFDQHYLEEFGVEAHRKTVERFRKEAQNGQDTELKSFAQQMLPTLEEHLQRATDLQNNRKRGGTRRDDTPTKNPQS